MGSATEFEHSGKSMRPIRTWGAITRHDRYETIDVAGVARRDFELIDDRLVYACRFEAMPGADRLFVLLRAVLIPGEEPPVFYSDCYSATEMGGHILMISDPSLFLDPEIIAGCFYGTREQDAVHGVIRIAERVAVSVGLDRSRIVYWAPSSAAMGAGMAAIKSGACAVLVNAYLDGTNMGGSQRAAKIAEVFGADSADEVTQQYPLRAQLPAALAAANALGLTSRLLLVQNLVDQSFYERQYAPFCEQFGIPAEGGRNATGNLMSMVYSHASGHSLEPAVVRAQILTEHLPLLLQPMPAPSPERPIIFDVSAIKPGVWTHELPSGNYLIRFSSEPALLKDDDRMLGAAIRNVTLGDEQLSLSDPAFESGFYPTEANGAAVWRWTNGTGLLRVAVPDDGCRLEFEVALVAADLLRQQT
jgi:hypothetical protein